MGPVLGWIHLEHHMSKTRSDMGVFPTKACPRQIHHRSKSPRPIGMLEHVFFHDSSFFFESMYDFPCMFHIFSMIFPSNSPCQSLPSGRMWPLPRFQCWPRPQSASPDLSALRRAAGGGESRCGTAGWQCQSHAWQVPMKSHDKTMIDMI